MGDDPYKRPWGATGSEQRILKHKLRGIAATQRFVCQMMLGMLALYLAGAVVIVYAIGGELLLGFIGIGIAAGQMIGMFLLGKAVYGHVATALLLTLVLAMFPCVGLIAMFVVSIQATNMLKFAGYDVGVMGADLSQFD